MKPYHIGFIIEQALGHKTHGMNLQSLLEGSEDIQPYWILPEWKRDGWASRIPIYRSNWTLQSGWQARRGLDKLFSTTRLDALFFHTQVPAILSAKWVKKIPSIVSLDATPLQYDELGESYQHSVGPDWLERMKFRLNQNCFDGARHLVTWSQWAKESLIRDYGVPADKISVIYPGVNSHIWKRSLETEKDNRIVRILFVGGDFRRKGGEELLEAFRSLKKRLTNRDDGNHQKLELHLVTESEIETGESIHRYHGIKPNSDRLLNLFRSADVFCLPTWGDCIPLVLAEAAMTGLPLISTRVAAIPEIVQDGVNGFLIEPGDVSGLTSALYRLIVNPQLRMEMGARSQEIALADHDSVQNGMRLLQLLQNVKELQ